jgi:hypothetical protein
MMKFHEWVKKHTPGYFQGDDNNTIGYLRDCWQAAQEAERERCREVACRLACTDENAEEISYAISALGDK